MNLVKVAARTVLHGAGGIGLLRVGRRRGLRILMYHAFADDCREALDKQCAHIRDHYSPVGFDEIGAWLDGAVELPSNALAVTVDDGYRDFAENAWPVFRRYQIPAVVYLVSGFCDRRLWLWTDQVSYLFEHTALNSFDGMTLSSDGARRRAARSTTEAWKKLPDAERRERLARLPSELGVALPDQPPTGVEALSWEEVRRLAKEGVTFGCHTDTHPILSRLDGRAAQAEEISHAKSRIEQELGTPVRHFCYPNGKTADFNSDTVDVLREANFSTSVVTEIGLNYAGADRYRLLRVGAEPELPLAYFAEVLVGLHT